MDDRKLQSIMKAEGIDLLGATTLNERALQFERALRIVIPPKDVSDRTTFRNISNWLKSQCRLKAFDEHTIFRRVLDFAVEASSPKSRNPAAVFITILKKELHYNPRKEA